MSACIGAEAAGARAMTATSANGLSLMWEMIYIASSLRLPIVLSLVNRAVSGPLNITMTILMLWVCVMLGGLCYFQKITKKLMIIC